MVASGGISVVDRRGCFVAKFFFLGAILPLVFPPSRGRKFHFALDPFTPFGMEAVQCVDKVNASQARTKFRRSPVASEW